MDATTEAEIAAFQEREDEEEAMRDTARYARRVPAAARSLADRAGAAHRRVSRDDPPHWEQGKRCPTGAARALLRVLDRAPETALRVLT